MITDGNRHIDRRYMLIREKVKLGHIKTVWMSGDLHALAGWPAANGPVSAVSFFLRFNSTCS